MPLIESAAALVASAVISKMFADGAKDSTRQRDVKNALEGYYKRQIRKFEKKDNDFKNVLGELSLEEAYIHPNTIIDGAYVSLVDRAKHWFTYDENNVLLVYGEPGHGKTTFSQYLVYDFAKQIANKNDNVVQRTLNEANFLNSDFVIQCPLKLWDINDDTNSYYNLESAFRYSKASKTILKLDELPKGTLLILDGFDEVAITLKEKGISSYLEFKKSILDEIAFDREIHIIVTSRTNAVKDYISDNPEDALGFAPLTYKQQEEWCENFYTQNWNEYYKYICFDEKKSIQEPTDFQILLQVPFIFRMIVHCNYRLSSNNNNQAGLYADLFGQTIDRMSENIADIKRKEKLQMLDKEYQTLAYKIWCNDTDTAVVDKSETDVDFLLFSYYLKDKSSNKQHRVLGFLHRTFYQYYMALYLYNEIIRCDCNNVKSFLEKLAERELDKDILRLFGEIVSNGEHNEHFNVSARCVITAMEKTSCILTNGPSNEKGDAEKRPYARCNNIYINGINLCFYFDVVDEFNKSKELKKLLRDFHCNSIQLITRKFGKFSTEKKIGLSYAKLIKSDLSNACVKKANLSYSNLRGAKLSNADLDNADLSNADLSNADLSNVDLNRADLSNADLSNADLNRVNLRGANLSDAYLREANLNGANLNGVNLSNSYLSGADLRNTDLSNACVKKAYLREANLNGADLSNADLNNANLNIASLCNADLSNADLSRANLREVYLNGAILSNAKLNRADLNGANLSNADLNNANLSNADLNNANLSNADLNGAYLIKGALDNARNVSEAKTDNIRWIDPDD